MADVLPLHVASFNCRGYNIIKRNYIRSVLSKVSVSFLQEVWLSDGQMQELANIDNHFLLTGHIGFDNSDVLTGRPHGGVAILWKSDLAAKIAVIDTNSKRACAVRMESDAFKLLFVNAYMPYESDDCSTAEFANQLIVIEDICNANSDCHVIAGGDFNVDFTRDRCHTLLLDNFCESVGLNPAVRHCNNNIDYTYHFNLDRFSIIDHFLLSGSLYENSINNVFALHNTDNTSDHEPVILQLTLEMNAVGFRQRTHAPRASWAKATNSDCNNYRQTLSSLLGSIAIPVDAMLCTDLTCHDILHPEAVHNYAKHITDACTKAADVCIPCTRDRQNSGCIPGWSEHIKPLRDKSLFWHGLWIDCNRPKTGAVTDCMRRTRAAYHYAIRQLEKDENSIVRERVAEAILSDGKRHFWSEIKRIRSNKSINSRIVDGLTDVEAIAKLFATKYRELYTSVPYDKDDMQRIIDDVNDSIKGDSTYSDCIVHLQDVKSVVGKLKPHKNDGGSCLSTDNFINAGDDCFKGAIIICLTALTSVVLL